MGWRGIPNCNARCSYNQFREVTIDEMKVVLRFLFGILFLPLVAIVSVAWLFMYAWEGDKVGADPYDFINKIQKYLE